MSETKLCNVCGEELVRVYYANDHEGKRCWKCENDNKSKFCENDSETDK